MKDFIIGCLKIIACLILIFGVLKGFIYLTETGREEDRKKCEENGGIWVEGVNYMKDYCIYKEK